MKQSSPEPTLIVRTYMYTLAAMIGGIGGIGMYLGTELWHLAIGAPLVLLAAILVRMAKHRGEPVVPSDDLRRPPNSDQ